MRAKILAKKRRWQTCLLMLAQLSSAEDRPERLVVRVRKLEPLSSKLCTPSKKRRTFGPMGVKDVREGYEFEITKILAKVMQSSYRRKEVHDLVLRVVGKAEKVFEAGASEEETRRLREEYERLRDEALEMLRG
jgi:hypothetical protein